MVNKNMVGCKWMREEDLRRVYRAVAGSKNLDGGEFVKRLRRTCATYEEPPDDLCQWTDTSLRLELFGLVAASILFFFFVGLCLQSKEMSFVDERRDVTQPPRKTKLLGPTLKDEEDANVNENQAKMDAD